jgi:hypothetical protein
LIEDDYNRIEEVINVTFLSWGDEEEKRQALVIDELKDVIIKSLSFSGIDTIHFKDDIDKMLEPINDKEQLKNLIILASHIHTIEEFKK